MDEIRKSESGPPAAGAISERLHEIVALSRDFERHVGQALMVNSTDLAAMECLITAGSLTPSELSRRLDISTAATTLVVDRLVALKHVTRHPHAHDRRKVVVVPAPESVARAFAELRPVIGGVAVLENGMSTADRLVVETFLAGVRAIYAAALETPPLETPPLETPALETPPLETPPLETPPLETPDAGEAVDRE